MLANKSMFSQTVDQVNVQERVARLFSRSIKKESKVAALNNILSMIDLTTLEGKDSPGKVRQLCYKAAHLHNQFPDLPEVAAVCVFPPMVPVAKKALRRTGIKIASVATAFPSGMSTLAAKLEEVKAVVGAGADEVDMVISRGAFLRGEYDRVGEEIAKVKETCCEVHLKVILDYVGSYPGFLFADREKNRHETSWRDQQGKVSCTIPGNGAGNPGSRLALFGTVPFWCQFFGQ